MVKLQKGKSMTGENYIRFIRSNKKDEHLEKMKDDLLNLRNKWSEEYHRQDDEGNYICDLNNLGKIHEKIEKLKHYIYTYVYNRNSVEYTREFERKYLW